MSGFIALVNVDGAPIDSQLLQDLTTSLHIRGPDQRKTWIDGPVGLGHTLFKTADEAEYDNQPASLDNKVWITGSIRIDDRPGLIKKLGLTPRIEPGRTPDSELVLHAYRAWGEKCLDHLLGDFAFVIWDRHKQQLFCAKDRFGMRQLYYARKADVLVISNSLHTMLSHPELSRRLDDKAIGGFLLFGDHTWLDKSITAFSDVKVLPPAHWLSLDNGTIRVQRYWDLPASTPLLNYRKEIDYTEHFQEVFTTAIDDRIRTSDIVVAMSGGMDSSAVAAIAREVIQQKYQSFELNAATITYDEIYHCEESAYAGMVSTRLGIPIQYTSGDDFPFLSQWAQTSRPLEIEQPGLWLDFERTQRRLGRVTLTGNAGDNLFHYPSTLVALRETNVFHVLAQLIKSRQRYGLTPGIGSGLRGKLKSLSSKNKTVSNAPYPFPTWLNPDFEQSFQLKEQWIEMWEALNKPAYQRSRYSALKRSLLRPDWTDEDLLTHSHFTPPEQLDPYLDLRVVEFVLSLPSLPWLFNKDILRRTLKDKLPVDITSRPKTPLGHVNHSIWQRDDLKWIDEWQGHEELGRYIERNKVPRLVKAGHAPLTSYVNLRPLLLNKWLEQTKAR